MLWSATIIASGYCHRSAKCRSPACRGCIKNDAERNISGSSIFWAQPTRFLVALALILCATFSVRSDAAERLAPTKQSQLQALSECTNAMCRPRELNRQVNLVRAVARKLKSLGYTISDPSALPEDSPDLSGMYYPALRAAVRQYKQDHNIADGNTDIPTIYGPPGDVRTEYTY